MKRGLSARIPTVKSPLALAPRADNLGFTLLELLIASFLLGVVVLALWSLFSVYAGLMEAGFRRVEQTQVVRAIVEQLRTDLRHAIQDPVGGLRAPRPGGAPVRRFGLWGTSNELRFDILQPPPAFDLAESSSEVGQGEPLTGPQRLPELRTVYYRFSAPLETDRQSVDEIGDGLQASEAGVLVQPGQEAEALRLPGLLRWEKDFETPEKTATGEVPPAELVGSATAPSLGDIGSTGETGQQPTLGELYSHLQSLYGPEVLYVPEVTELEFRYFDGQSWSTSWDSLSRQALPVAIEVKFRIDPQTRLARQTIVQPTGPQPGQEDQQIGPVAAPSGGEVFRVVIEIPGSPRFEGPRAPARPAAGESRIVLPRPSIPPRPLPLARPLEPRPQLLPSDQWMRVSP